MFLRPPSENLPTRSVCEVLFLFVPVFHPFPIFCFLAFANWHCLLFGAAKILEPGTLCFVLTIVFLVFIHYFPQSLPVIRRFLLLWGVPFLPQILVELLLSSSFCFFPTKDAGQPQDSLFFFFLLP